MTATARLRLFGPFDMYFGDAAAAPRSARAESLLAYLVMERDSAHPRERLAFLLWPDSTAAQARTNLRHVLHTLRRDVPEIDCYLEATARTVRWRPDAPVWLDVAEYEHLVAASDGRAAALSAAVELYRGEFAEGRDDGWQSAERDRLAGVQRRALAELAGLCEAAGEFADAVRHTEELLRHDPLDERAYRSLMRLHDAVGDRARALRAYHLCASTIDRELGVEPSARTRAAYHALRTGLMAVHVPAGPRRSGRSPLVGRVAECGELTATWRSAAAGAARFVLVSGEPGIGKTRLVEELRAWCARQGASVSAARCYPAEGPLAYGPVTDWLRSAAIRPQLGRLDRARLGELVALLPELTSEFPGLEPPSRPAGGDGRHRLFDALAAALTGHGTVARLLVVDDVQYADPESCQLLHYLLRIVPQARLLVVATARSGDVDAAGPLGELLAGLRARDRVTETELTRLGRAETALLAEQIGGAALGAADAARLHAETEGNPLHVVEALRGGWEPGAPLSPRVQSVIEGRLAQLDDGARMLVGIAATIGREFSTDVLAAAADEGTDVVPGLDELWRRRIVREQGPGGQSYDFAHDRIRQVAYAGLTPARRRRLHQRVAAALEQVNATAPEPVSAQIAEHHERAGATEEAITWLRRAAEAALLLHAHPRAVALLERALALSARLPRSDARDAVELGLHTALLAPLVPVHGYASATLSATQRRTRELAAGLGVQTPAPVLRSLAVDALTRADFDGAAEYGRLLQETADRRSDDVLVVEAAYVLGIAAFWRCELGEARVQFERALRHYRPADRRTHLIGYVQDPKVVCQSRLANTLWFLGDAAAAVCARTEALAWAAEIGHDFSRGTALTFAAMLALDMGDEPGLREYVAALATLGAEGVHRQVTAAYRGYVAVLDGDHGGGLATVRAAERRTMDSPMAPGQAAVMHRIVLAAHAATGDPGATRAAARRLLAAGGAARLWAPVARRLLADLS